MVENRFARTIGPVPNYGLGGFFPPLKTAQDLFAKLERDFDRLKASPSDAYVAYDFFVTANHLVDWCWPGDSGHQKSVRRNDAIPRICEHLANGAKHLTLNHWHGAVQHADAPPTTGELVIELGPSEAAALGHGKVTALKLAEEVIRYWKPKV